MTRDEFNAACMAHAISPDIALENDSVAEALEERNDEEVRRILREDF